MKYFSFEWPVKILVIVCFVLLQIVTLGIFRGQRAVDDFLDWYDRS